MAYYTQADITDEPTEFWGKIWFLSNSFMTFFLAIGLWLGLNDPIIRKASLAAATYQFILMIFIMCWLNEIARTDSWVWQGVFFILIFIINLIFISNERLFKK